MRNEKLGIRNEVCLCLLVPYSLFSPRGFTELLLRTLKTIQKYELLSSSFQSVYQLVLRHPSLSLRLPAILSSVSSISRSPTGYRPKDLIGSFPPQSLLPRKEVIQPHLPIRLPCYDFTPVIGLTFGSWLLAVTSLTSGAPNSHGVTGGVYKARERIHRGMLIRDY